MSQKLRTSKEKKRRDYLGRARKRRWKCFNRYGLSGVLHMRCCMGVLITSENFLYYMWLTAMGCLGVSFKCRHCWLLLSPESFFPVCRGEIVYFSNLRESVCARTRVCTCTGVSLGGLSEWLNHGILGWNGYFSNDIICFSLTNWWFLPWGSFFLCKKRGGWWWQMGALGLIMTGLFEGGKVPGRNRVSLPCQGFCKGWWYGFEWLFCSIIFPLTLGFFFNVFRVFSS